jgi:hypothetical protein
MGRWAQRTRQSASNSSSTVAFLKTAVVDAIDDTIVHAHWSQPIPPTTFANSDFHDADSDTDAIAIESPTNTQTDVTFAVSLSTGGQLVYQATHAGIIPFQSITTT